MRSGSFALLAVLSLAPTGCAVFRRMGGVNTVSLEKADIKSVGVDLRKTVKTICPREPVQMAVFVEARMKGDKAPKNLETWEGPASANRNDKLDFNEFAFHSDQGTFDDDSGWFTPSRDLTATAGREFEIVTAYKRRPDQFTFTTKYKPDYACVQTAGTGGETGHGGSSGPAGKSGTWGSGEGADGTDGGDGEDGEDGGDGGDGPRLVAHVTFVKTPFYDRLLAVSISGETNDLLLAPPDRTLTLRAIGGSGGPGGSGGTGGQGGPGSGGPQNGQGGNGGKGGKGGHGGKGGKGGKGGDVEVIIDTQFPELAKLITVDVAGGPGGGGGNGGPGGSGGNQGGSSGQYGKSGHSGQRGPEGQRGQGGQQGPAGRTNSHPGAVGAVFAGMTSITPLGTPEAAPPPKAEPKGKPGDKKKGGK